jgi:LacI family transcriptional regulator
MSGRSKASREGGPAKQVTMADIASEAGVSKATVSRVLSNPEIVTPETRGAILDIMRKHGYVPNALARGLAGTPTRIIGVVIDELANFFFIEVTEGIDSVVSAEGYTIQLSSSKWIPEREEKLVRSLISNRVDGILIAPVAPESAAVSTLKDSGLPFVVMNCVSEDPEVSYVSTDNRKGGRIVAEYLNASLRREQTILVSGFNHQSISDRLQGFSEVFDSSMGDLIRYSNVRTYEEGYELVPLLLARNSLRTRPSAIFVLNDNVALGIVARLLELEVAVPEQVAVVGYDDIRLASFCRVPLSTVSQSVWNIGRLAAMSLLSMLDEPASPPERHLIEPQLIIRQSSPLPAERRAGPKAGS